MRLTCPNCGAQYEVPDDVIPPSGRDVQCSNCGDTWFQAAPEESIPEKDTPQEANASEESESQEPPAPEAQTQVQDTPTQAFEEIEPPELTIGEQQESDDSDPEDPSEPEARESAFDDWDADDHPDDDDDWSQDQDDWDDDDQASQDAAHDQDDAQDDDEDQNDDTKPGAPRALAPSVAEVLRQEAEHEARVRASESIETQTELGLESEAEAPDRRALEAQARMRRLRGLPEGQTSPEISAQGQTDSRRDLLPDIEEINSSLRAGGESVAAPDTESARSSGEKKRRGFRLGFALIVMLAAFGVFAYNSDQELAETYPAAAPYLDSFVTSANSARVWLDTQVTTLFLKLNEIASGSE